jgi:aspartate aminotransferase-like enzyme
VDAITGLGTKHLDVDGWGVDVIIGGSQKALMMPPGLAYCAVSERAWKRMNQTTSPRYYFDLRKERKSAAKGESAYTHATSLFAALGAALEFIRGLGNGDLAKNSPAASIARAVSNGQCVVHVCAGHTVPLSVTSGCRPLCGTRPRQSPAVSFGSVRR